MARKDWNFKAEFMGVFQLGGQWVIDTSKGKFIAIGSAETYAPRLADEMPVGRAYWFTVNRANKLRYMRKV